MKRALATLALLLSASTASASIAVFVDGRNLKIASYRVEADTIHLEMNGGLMSLPLSRIDRIVDDEVETAEVVEEAKKIVAEGVLPQRSWRFDEKSVPLFRTKYDDLIVEAARHFDVDAALVSAVIKAESDYNPRIVSHKGARGLMQLMPATAERFGVTNAFNPRENVYAGTRYLKWLLRTFDGNADFAVAAYNAGEGNVWKHKGVPPFRETVNYIRRIAGHLKTAAIQAEVAAEPAVVTAGLRR
jgi:hypothetical protein